MSKGGRGAARGLEQPVSLQGSRPMLDSLQEVSEPCLVSLSPTHCP